MQTDVINVVIAGIGGQGVLKASDILADAAFREGYDVKKSEIHGMSQRGGSVTSDVRFGPQVFSPMISRGSADFLVILEEDQIAPNQYRLRPGGTLIDVSSLDGINLSNRKTLNVVLLGILSYHLPISVTHWEDAIRANLPEKLHEVNMKAFHLGRDLAQKKIQQVDK